MAYDFVNQMTGPDIKVDLFGDAATSGTNVGNAIKPTLSAAISGFTTGVKDVQEIISNDLTIEGQRIRNEQAPLDTALKREQLENAQTAGDIASLRLAREVLNQDLNDKAEQAKLEAEILEANKELSLGRKLKEYNEVLATGDKFKLKDTLFGSASGQYAELFAKNPDLYRDGISRVETILDPSERFAADYKLGKASLINQYQTLSDASMEKYNLGKVKVFKNSKFQEAIRKEGVSPEQGLSIFEIAPTGRYKLVEGTTDRIQINNKTKEKEPGDFRPENQNTILSYDLIVGDRIVQSGLTKEEGKDYTETKAAHHVINGDSLRGALANYDKKKQEEFTEQQTAAASNPSAKTNFEQVPRELKPTPSVVNEIPKIPVYPEPGKGINISGNVYNYRIAQNLLGLDPEAFKSVQKPIQNIFQILEAPKPKNWYGELDPEDAKELTSSINEAATTAAAKLYDQGKADKKVYNEEAVKQHNNYVSHFKEAMRNPMSKFYLGNILGIGSQYSSIKGYDFGDMVYVYSPKELYTLRQGNSFKKDLQKMYDAYDKNIRQSGISLGKPGSRRSDWENTNREIAGQDY